MYAAHKKQAATSKSSDSDEKADLVNPTLLSRLEILALLEKPEHLRPNNPLSFHFLDYY